MSKFVALEDLVRLAETMEGRPLILMVVLVVVPTIAALVCLVYMCRRCRGGKKKPATTAETLAKEHKEHKKKDEPQFKMATSSSMKLLKALDIGMNQNRVLSSLGSRRRKVWFQLLSSDNYQPYLLSMAEVPKRFRGNETSCRDNIMREFGVLHKLTHPHLQPLHTLCLCSKKGEVLAGGPIHRDVSGSSPVLTVSEQTATPPLTEQQVAIVELFHEKGSLKDYIHNVSPALEWMEKYSGEGTPLTPAKVAQLGSQILKAIQYLYYSVPESMLPLGHIRIENIYMEKKSVCKLGGYDNTFLGYGCWLQKEITQAGYASSMDIIMFGHVMYYMCSGGEMKTDRVKVVLPEEEHFKTVNDKCRDILRYIFKMRKGKIKHSWKEIANHSFFTGSDNAQSSESEEEGKRFNVMAKLKQKTKALLRNNDSDEGATNSPKNKTKLFQRKPSKPKED